MADDDSLSVGQNEIEDLLKQAQSGGASDEADAPAPAPPAAQEEAGQSLDQDEIEALLSKGGQSSAADSSQEKPQESKPAEVSEDSDKILGQNDIEALLQKAGPAPTPAPASSPSPPSSPRPAQAEESDLPQQDLEFLLHQAESALASVDDPARDEIPEGVATFKLESFGGAPPSTSGATLELVRDVDLSLRIELGRTQMYLEDVLKLRKGSVVPLDKLAGDPVDVYVNGRLIARGEVLVLNDNFCVRVAELIAGDESKAAG